MTREEFKKIVVGMKAIYTSDKFIPDAESFTMWFMLLEDLPYRTVANATYKYMCTEKFPPTVAEIRQLCTEHTELTSGQAWDTVLKAIKNSAYSSAEEFDKLPEEIQRAVGSASQLKQWATDENFNGGVESSNFKRVYESEKTVREQNAQLPNSLKTLNKALNKAIERQKCIS